MDSPSDRRVEFFRGLAGLSAIRGEWQRILGDIEHPHFFHLPEFYEAAGTVLALDQREQDLVFAVLRDGDQASVVFPFVVSTSSLFGMRLRVLESPQPWHLAGDLIGPRDETAPELFSSLIRGMVETSGIPWDMIHLPAVLEDACAAPLMRGATGGMPFNRRYTGECCYVPLASYEEMQGRFSAKYRRELRRRSRMMDRDGKVEYLCVTGLPELQEAFEEFLRIEAAGWKGKRQTAVRNKDANVGEFYRQFIRRFAEMGQCEIFCLRLDGRTIAVQLVATAGDTCYLMKIAHDEEYRRYSPGHQVVQQVLRDYAEREGMSTVNLCSDAAWLGDLEPLSYPVYSVRIFRRRPKAILAHAFYRGKTVARRLLGKEGKPS